MSLFGGHAKFVVVALCVALAISACQSSNVRTSVTPPATSVTTQVQPTYPATSFTPTLIPIPTALSTRTLEPTAMATLPPPPAPVPPNTSRVTALVRKQSVWSPGSLAKTPPPVTANVVLYSLSIEILTSDSEDSSLENFAQPGVVYEVFSQDSLSADLVGKKIQATINLTGSTNGVRWFFSNLKIIP